MKCAKTAAFVLTVLMVISCLPIAFSQDSSAVSTNPDDFVYDDTIHLKGFAHFEDASSSGLPTIYVFVVYYDVINDVHKYVNVNNGKLMSAEVMYNPANQNDPKNYLFDVEVPLIKEPSANYYVCAFNGYEIGAVSDKLSNTTEEIVADGSWPANVKTKFNACEIDRTAWDTVSPNGDAWITGNTTNDLDCIFLSSARGTVRGHVIGEIAGNTNDLNNVAVEFYNKYDDLINTARTDKNGYFSTSLPTGDYTVKFSRGNYVCDPVEISVVEGTNDIGEFKMTISVDKQFFGYDLTHFLMLTGGGVCFVIIVIAIAYQFNRIKGKKPAREWIYNDMDNPDEENKKEN